MLGNKVSMYDYEKVLSALKKRGYMMVFDKDTETNLLTLSVVSKCKGTGFVHKYVWLSWDINADDEIEFCVDSTMNSDIFCSLSIADLNAITKARNDLLYFCDLLNDLHIAFLDMQNGVSVEVLNRFRKASVSTGATVLVNLTYDAKVGFWV